ncbi:Clp protease N-terminal domain-containing protein [Streptomyces sp. AK02-01A]|uniref:Clp protease N-terminal domain-containing protein n=1 Tax=Streptomyces sp. AK02-01A TaxID=3028648 RepID=UPI0029A2E05F|nr:Clp protease N-terminal domain-containing protein [Streptomyces sp. AK02-01A]MDX3855318.1 Clp protease N-terminal domain-containing protein [Streptomyces sp. AK02-01A]
MPAPAGIDARLTPELAAVVSGARRRALRDGDTQIDTAHLLHSLLEADPEVRSAFAGGPQVARVLGYLVQRSIGYGLRWQGTVEDSGAIPVARDHTVTGWSPPAVTAMERAPELAALRGEERAGGLDLLAALTCDGACRAVEVLERAGVDTRSLSGRLNHASRQV